MYKVVVRIRSQLDQLGSAFQENITLTGHTKDLNKISVEFFFKVHNVLHVRATAWGSL